MNGLVRTVADCWRLAAASYFQAVWSWRVSYFDSTANVQHGHHAGVFNRRLRTNVTTLAAHVRKSYSVGVAPVITSIMKRAFLQDIVLTPRDVEIGVTPLYIMFYGGTTQGRRGPSSSGLIALKLLTGRAEPEVVWTAGMSYASSNFTLSEATMMGVLTGLRTCLDRRFLPLRLAGSDKWTADHLGQRRPPRTGRLKTMYWKIQRVLNSLGDVQWLLHPREANRAATALATTALESGKSRQWYEDGTDSVTERWNVISRHVATDMAHWTKTMDNAAQGAAAAVRL